VYVPEEEFEMPRIKILLPIFLILGWSILVNGCHFQTRLPSEAEHASIEQHTKVMVLIRLKAVVGGKAQEKISFGTIDGKGGFGIRLASIDSGKSPKFVFGTSPTSEARRQGWIYLVLAPGSYHLTVVTDKRRLVPDFLLHVPRDKKLVYAGTLIISCKGRWGFFETLMGECSGVNITDEGGAAQAIAKAYFGEFGLMSTALLKEYGTPMAPQACKELFPMGLITTSTKDIVSPAWTKRGIARTTGIGAIPDDAMVRGVMDAGAGLGTAYLLYLPVGLAVGGISGKAAESKWRPCIEELARQIPEVNPAAVLRQKLIEELSKYGPSKPVSLEPESDFSQEAARKSLKSLLQAEIQRIQLRECQERGSFCVEVTLRARLVEVDSKNLSKDVVLLYSNLSPYYLHGESRPNELQTWKSSPCRKMEDYCGAEAKQVLREEVGTGINYLVERLCFELGLLSK
jgi:hypothetical protein